MTDPYRVLGIAQDATDEQVKDAYRQLARKYHPDNYINNPLSDLATEKMKEINEAYEEVQRQRRTGGRTGSVGSTSGYSGSSQFSDIRGMINNGRPAEAEELLDGVPGDRRDAEWYFLKGTIAYSRGWIDSALQNFTTACQKNPANQEYRAALNRLSYQRQSGYSQTGRYAGGAPMGGGSSCCDLCATIYCANCLCDCMTPGC
ncbi:MAG: J domain-containing protein [Angelakisella sp.]